MDEGLLNDLLECSVCLERLDTSSRVLPCQHTFCLKCLKVIVESHKELRCPECRVLVETKVEELPPNVLLMRILEGMRNSAPRRVLGSVGRGRIQGGHSQAQPGAQQASQGAKYILPHARAMHDFVSKESNDLSFKKGEFIILHKKLDNCWYVGESSGRTGMFPITYVQVMVPLPVSPALCKALYDFRMSAPDEEGCLAFDKGAIITVHRRVDENWAEGRLDQRVGIFPIAFVEFNHAARQLINGTSLNRPVPAIPDQVRAGHSDHRQHTQPNHRFQQMSMSTPTTVQGNYQNVPTMSQSHPNYSAAQMLVQPPPILAPQTVQTKSHGVLVTSIPRAILEPTHTKNSLDLIHFTNIHNKCQQATMGLQSVQRISDNCERLRAVKFDSYNSTPVHKAAETTYQNVRNTENTTVTLGSLYSSQVSSDSSSSMNTPSVGASSTTTPNTSSNTSTCESNEPSVPSSPDNNTERNATAATAEAPQNEAEENDREANTSAGVTSVNESSTATNTSLNVSLPPTESPKTNASPQNASEEQETATNGNADARLDAAGSSKSSTRPSDAEILLTFGLGLQAAMSPSHGKEAAHTASRSHRDHHHRDREKRHSLTPSSHLQGNTHNQNRHSAEIVATSLLDHAPERDRERDRDRERERRRRRSRSTERALPATYVAIYPYRPQKPDELELKKGGVYTVTERCRDGWFKGWSERSQRCGVFPGNYVAAAHLAGHRSNHDKVSGPSSLNALVPSSSASSATPAGQSPAPPPDAPPRARSPLPAGQTLAYPWGSPFQAPQQSTPRADKAKDKSKAERSTISTGVSLMKRLAAMKKCKSPPPVGHGLGYSIDNPVFEDAPGLAAVTANDRHDRHPVHVRSGSCPSQLLRALPAGSLPGSAAAGAGATDRTRHKDRTGFTVHDHHHAHRAPTEGPWQTQHRKSQSLDVTASRRDRHHSQPVKERFRCIVPYPPNSEYELELKVDDIVIVTKTRGDGWYKGTLQRTGRTGLFPASFVESCPQD